jgi:hypothetical protein
MEQMTKLLKAMQEMIETLIGSLASKMDTNQAKSDTKQEEMGAKMDSHHEKLVMIMKAGKEKREACLEKMEVRGNEV